MLPADAKPRDVIRALERLGWALNRHAGGHAILCKKGKRPLTVPMHEKVKNGTLRAIIRQAGVSVKEFVAALKS